MKGFEAFDDSRSLGHRKALIYVPQDIPFVAPQGLKGALAFGRESDVDDSTVLRVPGTQKVPVALENGHVPAHRRKVDAQVRRQRTDRQLVRNTDFPQSLELFESEVATTHV
jgi:hypothetical protein